MTKQHTPTPWNEDGRAIVGPDPRQEVCVCTGVDAEQLQRLLFLRDAARQYLESVDHGRADGVLLGYLRTCSDRVQGRA